MSNLGRIFLVWEKFSFERRNVLYRQELTWRVVFGRGTAGGIQGVREIHG
jgi:hypothetical protein